MSSKKSKKAAAKRKNEKAKKARSLEAARDAKLNKSEAGGGNAKGKAEKETAKAPKKANAKPAGKTEKTKKDKIKKVKKEKVKKEKVEKIKTPRAPVLWKAAAEKIRDSVTEETKRIIAAVAVVLPWRRGFLLCRVELRCPRQSGAGLHRPRRGGFQLRASDGCRRTARAGERLGIRATKARLFSSARKNSR